MLEELKAGARDLFGSVEANPMSPYVKKDLTLDVYISDYVYRTFLSGLNSDYIDADTDVAYAFL